MAATGGFRAGRARHRALASTVLLAAVLAAAVPGRAPAGAGPGPVRYLDPVFSDVVVTPDQHYRTAVDCTATTVDLHLDLYEPAGDAAAARPLFVWIHGGSFASGDKAGALEVAVATDFARRGYVVASIAYRLCPSFSLAAIENAGEDAAAAVAYLRGRATELRIDPDRVAVGGASAGAITATLVGYAPDRSLGEGGPSDPSHVDAVASLAGAGFGGDVEAGEPPLFMAHGTDDPIIDISLAHDFCDAVDAAGPGCTFHEYPAGHETLVAYFADIEAVLFPWLYDVLDLSPPPLDPAPTTTLAPSSPTTAAPTASVAAQADRPSPVAARPTFTG